MLLAGVPVSIDDAPVLVGEKHLGAQLFGLMLRVGADLDTDRFERFGHAGDQRWCEHIQPRVGDQQVPAISAPVQVGYRTVTEPFSHNNNRSIMTVLSSRRRTPGRASAGTCGAAPAPPLRRHPRHHHSPV